MLSVRFSKNLNNRCCAGPFGLELARKRARRQVCNSYLHVKYFIHYRGGSVSLASELAGPSFLKYFIHEGWFGLARERARRFREPPTSSLTPRHQSPHHQSEDRACLCNNCRH